MNRNPLLRLLLIATLVSAVFAPLCKAEEPTSVAVLSNPKPVPTPVSASQHDQLTRNLLGQAMVGVRTTCNTCTDEYVEQIYAAGSANLVGDWQYYDRSVDQFMRCVNRCDLLGGRRDDLVRYATGATDRVGERFGNTQRLISDLVLAYAPNIYQDQDQRSIYLNDSFDPLLVSSGRTQDLHVGSPLDAIDWPGLETRLSRATPLENSFSNELLFHDEPSAITPFEVRFSNNRVFLDD